MADVYILGSGFSKAISDRMPTLADLTNDVLDRLPDTGLRQEWKNGLTRNVELLLTHLSAPHPWWDPVDLHQHKALFHGATSRLRDVVEEGETSTRHQLQDGPPEWLRRLTKRWCKTEATIITFNYDTLLERTVLFGVSGGPYAYLNLYVRPIAPSTSRREGGAFHWPPDRHFRLLKLHGSLNWFFSGLGAPPGDIVYALPIPLNWRGSVDDETCRIVEDKVPMIVPPLLEKGPHLANDVVRLQWKRAREALAGADRIVFMGYSLPETDLGMRFLLATLPRKHITVVDRNPDAADQYQAILPDHHIQAPISGQDSIAIFVTELTRQD